MCVVVNFFGGAKMPQKNDKKKQLKTLCETQLQLQLLLRSRWKEDEAIEINAHAARTRSSFSSRQAPVEGDEESCYRK